MSTKSEENQEGSEQASAPTEPEEKKVSTKARVKANPPETKKLDINDLINALFAAYGENCTDLAKNNCPSIISQYLKGIFLEHPVYQKYNILILFDENSLVKGDSDRIYNAVAKFTSERPILMVLYSNGGSAESAYLIGKLCREYSQTEFHVAVPRSAKSAATMICCAADSIHMGSMSELGPIDPQINGLPALGLKNSVEHIAGLVKIHPEASSMFAEYLSKSLSLINLGYYERVAESAQQYAEKLLLTHSQNLHKDARTIAAELVYKYKDHGFVIDRAEAENIFGKSIIKANSDEYKFSNLVYNELKFITKIAGFLKKAPYYIGSFDTDIQFLDFSRD